MAKKLFVAGDAEAVRLAASPHLIEVVENARQQARARRERDPEWNLPRATSIRSILRAFSYGVLMSDQWHVGYRVPFGMEDVLNHLAAALEPLAREREVHNLSLIEIERIIEDALATCVTWRSWGGDPDAIVLLTSLTPVLADQKVPLDLEAVLQNTAILIRDERRTEDRRIRARVDV